LDKGWKWILAELCACIIMGSLLLYQHKQELSQAEVWSKWETAAEQDMSGAKSKQPSQDDHSPQERKKIALTFDDGPHPLYTEQILDGLYKRDVKATFFVMGQNAEKYPDIIRRISEEGHIIGNHTYHHVGLTSQNREEFIKEVTASTELIREITGQDMIYIRPPFGNWDKEMEAELNMFPVLWNVDPLDWCSTNVSCIVKNVVSKVKENDIILMHDYYPSTVTAALEIVDTLMAQGYEFVTVDEILFD
jgi:peptidoglycan/xylan/chitin deacetylase (PgdA/CDA1 family)